MSLYVCVCVCVGGRESLVLRALGLASGRVLLEFGCTRPGVVRQEITQAKTGSGLRVSQEQQLMQGWGV